MRPLTPPIILPSYPPLFTGKDTCIIPYLPPPLLKEGE